ncbi:MAG: hypothetical protein JNL57_02130 [Bacteroidetes bacterium]|nr:hypothetical protein [Bacteroidota bacterium]
MDVEKNIVTPHLDISELISKLKDSYTWHTEEANKAAELLSKLGVDVELSKPAASKSKVQATKQKSDDSGKRSFGNHVYDLLQNGYPIKIQDAIDSFSENTNTDINRRTAATILSMDKRFTAIQKTGLGANNRWWWVLSDWVVNGELKQEYENKILSSL